MVTKYLMSYEQLNSNCYAKQMCDMFMKCKGTITDCNPSNTSLRYTINPEIGRNI